MSSSSLIRTLLMACLGLLLGMIGIDNMTGHFRYSFNLAELGDGIGIVPVAVGLFGLGEILSTPSANAVKDIISPSFRDLLPTRKEWTESVLPITRGTVLGFIIGIIPGSAHVISSFLSYAVERRVSKHPEEFGKALSPASLDLKPPTMLPRPVPSCRFLRLAFPPARSRRY